MSQVHIVIPCFNEESTLEKTLSELKLYISQSTLLKSYSFQILVADDGSTDRSRQIAREQKVTVLELPHQGLAQTWVLGLSAAIKEGADWIITLDADGQYEPSGIGMLLNCISESGADFVIAERGPVIYPGQFWFRVFCHRVGAGVIRLLTHYRVQDPISGFRVYRASAAKKLKIRSHFTYTLESMILASSLGLKLNTVQIKARRTKRPSRLFQSVWVYLFKQMATTLRSAWDYKILKHVPRKEES